jgi:hypothetical protein
LRMKARHHQSHQQECHYFFHRFKVLIFNNLKIAFFQLTIHFK